LAVASDRVAAEEAQRLEGYTERKAFQMPIEEVNDGKLSSLAAKLAVFDAGLAPEERDIFRSHVLEAIFQNQDVEGHATQMHWGEDANGIYFQWISTGGGDHRQHAPSSDTRGRSSFGSAPSDSRAVPKASGSEDAPGR
jgi:hypothetical protein